MRLIDAVALERDGWRMSRTIQIDKNTMEYQTKKPMDFPAIGIKKGWWIPRDHNKKNGMVTTTVYYCPTCSVCGKTGGYDMNYCPHCGADMR